MAKKCVLILLDGLADRSHPELGHRTPLQAARTPYLDRLAAQGANGLYHASFFGQALPSEFAHLLMFGYDAADFPGRGALEALGAGIELSLKDVAVLAHFASLRETDGNLILDQNEPTASEDEALKLFDAINQLKTPETDIRLVRTAGLKGILTLKGEVAPFFTDSDPFINGRPLIEVNPWRSHSRDPASRKTAAALKSYLLNAYRLLSEHPLNQSRTRSGKPPINGIVTQRAGRLKSVTPFTEKYGLQGLSISSGIVYHGIATYLGLGRQKVMETRDPGHDMAERLALAGRMLSDYDFIHVHTKAADTAAHTKKPLAKKIAIESLDSGLGRAIGPLLDDPDILTVVTSDHSTPSSGPLVHSGGPVPMLFHGHGVRRDAVTRFDEIDAATGALGNVRGSELMFSILSHLDRSKLRGVMDTPVDQAFWPGNSQPFGIDPQRPEPDGGPP